MAQKRRLEGGAPSEPEEDEADQDVPSKYHDAGWVEWARRDFLRYWYVVGCIAADTIIPLEVTRDVQGNAGVAVAVIALALLIAGEIILYQRLWHKKRTA